jgi:predicted Zn-dependent peptidase
MNVTSHALASKFSHIHTTSEIGKGRRNVAMAKACVCVLWLMTGALIAPLQAQNPDRSKPPGLGPPPTLQLTPIQHSQLSNGLPVLLLEKHEVPLLQLNLLVRVGATTDPPQKSGLASLTARMLTEGAGTRNALQLADAIDFLGARLSASAGQHTTVVALHTPLSKLDSALALVADVAMRPQFPSEELERARKELLTTLIEWHDEPQAIATVLFNKTLYGSRHPYGIPEIGNEQSLRSFTTEDLKQFHEKYFHSNNATLIVVGDVTMTSIQSKLEEAFGGWSHGDIPSANLPPVGQIKRREVYIVDKPGAPQSEIRIGCIGAPRLTDDYYAILVMNTILGGSFTSRLNQNLREQHGYAYGAQSTFDFMPEPGPFLAGAAVQTAVTDRALVEFMKELNGILQPVPDEEFARARNYVALRYPENFQSVAQIASQLNELVTYGLPDDYFNNYVQHVLAVTKDDVERAAKKYIDPEKVAIIVAGDQKQIEAGVKALNLGPLHTLTIDDVLGKAPVIGTEN